MRKLLVLVPLVFLAIVTAAACTGSCQVTLRTAKLLPSLFGTPLQLPLGIGAEPVAKSVIDVVPRHPGAKIELYRPATGRHPALVVSLGIKPAPPDDPRVVSLLTGLAQSGVIAALVESPDLDSGRLAPDAPDLLVAAFQLVSNQPSVMPNHVGLLGLSVGGSLALIAATDPQIANNVRLVEAIGAYDSLISLARSVVTKSEYRGGHFQSWEPAALAADAVRSNLLSLVPSPDVERLLTSPDAAAFDIAVMRLPAGERAALEVLSPGPQLRNIHAPVFLMVDESDSFIPASESASIAADLRRSRSSVQLSQFHILEHVEPGGGQPPVVLLTEGLRLFFHIRAVLGAL